MPANAVATGAHRDEQIALARVANGRDHVGDAGAAHDAGRPAVDRAVPDRAGLVVAIFVGADHEGRGHIRADARARCSLPGGVGVAVSVVMSPR